MCACVCEHDILYTAWQNFTKFTMLLQLGQIWTWRQRSRS